MGSCRHSRQPQPWLASYAHSDGHECTKGAATLHHGFPNAAHQLPTPHSDPETGKGAEERTSRHAYGATHHKTHLHAVEAAWLGLSVGTHGHRHLARGLGSSALRCTEKEPEGARGPRDHFRSARQYFRELGAEDCGPFTWWSLLLLPCCYEPLGGGRLHR